MTAFEELSSKYLEIANKLNETERLVQTKQNECDKLHGLLLVSGWTDIEINTYTYAEVKFYSENYAETILRHPSLKTDRERLKFIHELFLFYIHNGQRAFRTWDDIDATETKYKSSGKYGN